MAYSVLVVEDDENFLNSFKYILEHNGYHVSDACTGKRALKLLQHHTFDAAVIDLHLPDANGIEVADYIREHHRHTAIIILTGYATLDSALHVLRTGVSDYLCKPTHPEIILNTLARCIENSKLKQALVKSEERFRQLAEVTCEGIALIREEKIYQSNTQLAELFGFTEQELTQTLISDLLPDWQSSIVQLQDRVVAGLPRAAETLGRHHCGTLFPVEVRIQQLLNGDRNVLAVGIMDISERVKNEQQLLATQEKLAKAQRMESLGIMAGSVAHDLNNILSGLISFPELLLAKMNQDAPFRDELELIRKSGRQASDVVNDLLTVARGAKSKKEDISVNLLIKNYKNSINYRQLHQEFPDLLVDFELDSTIPAIRCSAIHITQTLTNLMTNAAEACVSQPARIRVRTTTQILDEVIPGYEDIPRGAYVVLSVTDSGSGISTGSLGHIFEPFYSEKELGRSGTGLGLTIIWNTVRDHNGYINLSSSKRGSRFDLYFPVAASQLKQTVKQPPLSLSGHGETILIVDDEKIQIEIARTVLQQLGYMVLTAGNGEEALELLKSEPVDLIILDMVMETGMSGYETFAAIQQLKPHQKAIVASGHYEPDEQEKILGLGISQYLIKPYSLACLGRAIRQELYPHDEGRS